VSSMTMMEDDEHPHQFSSISKLHNNGPTTTSVHDLLECPVCTNSMYPPIHQVSYPIHFAFWVCFQKLLDLVVLCFFPYTFCLCDFLMPIFTFLLSFGPIKEEFLMGMSGMEGFGLFCDIILTSFDQGHVQLLLGTFPPF